MIDSHRSNLRETFSMTRANGAGMTKALTRCSGTMCTTTFPLAYLRQSLLAGDPRCLIGNLNTTLSDTHPAFLKRLRECLDEMPGEFEPYLEAAAEMVSPCPQSGYMEVVSLHRHGDRGRGHAISDLCGIGPRRWAVPYAEGVFETVL